MLFQRTLGKVQGVIRIKKLNKPTIMDVASRAGVSKSTVSQFMNQRYEYMSISTKEKIEKAIQELGYHPNYIAKSLKQKRTLTVGIIVANILHHFSTQISRAIEDLCHERDYHVIICNADDNPEKERKYIKMLQAKQVDGIIAIPTEGNKELYAELIAERYPVIFLDRKIEGLSVQYVGLNNAEAAFAAVTHLYNQGHRKIGMLSRPLTISVRRERVEGYLKGIEHFGLDRSKEWLKCITVSEVNDTLNDMLALSDAPTALLIGNDLLLIEVLRFIRQRKIAVPDQLAFITFDEVNFSDLHQPPISAISQPAYEMGKKAAMLLLDQIEHKTKQGHVEHIFEANVNIRETCGGVRG